MAFVFRSQKSTIFVPPSQTQTVPFLPPSGFADEIIEKNEIQAIYRKLSQQVKLKQPPQFNSVCSNTDNKRSIIKDNNYSNSLSKNKKAESDSHKIHDSRSTRIENTSIIDNSLSTLRDEVIAYVSKPQEQASSVFKSASVREILPAQLKHSKDNPGPGAYLPSQTQLSRHKLLEDKQLDLSIINYQQHSLPKKEKHQKTALKALRQKQHSPSRINISALINSSYQPIPSIPDDSKQFGYRIGASKLQLNVNNSIRFSGMTDDLPGPCEYCPKVEPIKKEARAPNFHRSKVERQIFPQIKASNSQPNILIKSKVEAARPSLGTPCYLTEINSSNNAKNVFDTSKKNKENIRKSEMSMRAKANLRTASTNFKSQVDSDSSIDSDNEEYIETTPGPGSYNFNSSSFTLKDFRSKKPEYRRIFISQQDRLTNQNKQVHEEEALIGPGSYDLPQQICVPRTHPPTHAGFLAGNPRFKHGTPVSQQYFAEPASYKPRSTMESDLISRLVRGFKGRFGSNVQRFPDKENIVPGPGAYSPDKTIEQRMVEMHGSLLPSYKSSLRRQIFQIPFIQTPGPGDYTINRTLDKKEVNPDEAELEPKKVPFMSGQERFKELQLGRTGSKEVQKNVQNEVPKQLDMFRTYFVDLKNRPKPVKENAAAFNTSQKRLVDLATAQCEPQAGKYFDGERENKAWMKKSFNVLFQG